MEISRLKPIGASSTSSTEPIWPAKLSFKVVAEGGKAARNQRTTETKRITVPARFKNAEARIHRLTKKSFALGSL